MAVVTDTSNEQLLAELAAALADGVESALPPWVENCVRRMAVAYFGQAGDEIMGEAAAAGAAARDEVGSRVRALLVSDPDAQWTNPLAIVRTATAYPTAVLRAAGVPPVLRDAQAEAQFPDDDYDLTPAKFADLDPTLHEPSLAWGAAKAFVVKARRRGRGA
jgi:hypothetical protein